MKKYLVTLLCLLQFTLLFSQKKRLSETEQAFQDFGWNQTDYDSITEIPSEWDGESAVYLLKKVYFSYARKGNNIENVKLLRCRVKLLDNNAIEDFSEFRQKLSRGGKWGQKNLMRVKIIKENGTIILIDPSDIIKADDHQKLAIPNLVKGDIIDYFVYYKELVKNKDIYKYKSQENIIASEYPIVHYDFQLDTEKDFFININTYNNTPALLETLDGKKRSYSFQMDHIDKYDFPRWYYPFVEMPTYKFQVLSVRGGKYENRAYAFISEKAESLKKSVTKEEILDFYEKKFKPHAKTKSLKTFLKNNTFSSQEEKVRRVFYYIRYAYFTKYIEHSFLSKSDIYDSYIFYNPDLQYFINEEKFIRFFCTFLKEENIDYEILITTQRYNGDIKDLLLEENVNIILKVLTPDPIYLENFNQFALTNHLNPLLENTNAYALKVDNRKRIQDIESVTLPSSSFKQNNNTESLDLEFNSNMDSLYVKKVGSYYGHNKIIQQENKLNFYNYIFEDYTMYGVEGVVPSIKKKKTKVKVEKEYAAALVKFKKKQKEYLKEETEEEFEFKIYDYDYSFVQNGRYDTKAPFVVQNSFKVAGDVIKKAGKNYIINIGAFIGSQFEVNDKQRGRKEDVYMSNPRSYTNTIKLVIPKGYVVSGLDKLQIDVDNETGFFESTAKIDGNILIIKTNKGYKHYFEPNSNWPKMIAFLDAAYTFTQAKVLLKKQ